MAEKILIVEDQVIVQMGLEILLKDSFGSMILSFASDFQTALRNLSKDHFDLIILDINIPGGKNSKMIKKLREIQSEVKILVFTALEGDIYASHYLQAGADGFVSKVDSEKELVLWIKKLLFNSSSSLAISAAPISTDIFSQLSVREQEVLHQLIEGKFTKEIASHLNLKISTISTYKSRLFKKFNVENVIGLINKVQIYKDFH
ncbi:response regulator transcription factor [Dyadobacter sp. CY356]|uniref:response regulator transcription factor n=1 Tax=Dyadobacter sp. CY356 TaxID=2906442 RepID=UPI001F48FED6|nr:response regulator transcription factor [Dyadobacter sp. CY356]MCF0055069.1 response regulator transcription factor [Dyadobacter sp. CY356]